MRLLNSFSSGANVAVIGASGAIGSAAVQQLGNDPGIATVHAFARSACNFDNPKVKTHKIDLLDEASIARAAGIATAETPLDLVLVASGILHRGSELLPEKTLQQVTVAAMTEIFSVNTIGPTLVAKHFLPVMRCDEKSLFAALSARVGSISDNRLGGWVSYRASKVALNMVLKTFAIEQFRRCPSSIVVALHPGTVDSSLSKPFSGRVSDNSLFTPEQAAAYLLQVIDKLTVADSGRFFAWDGSEIEY